ncbi:metallophosphoesterase [Leifsonia sp. Root112D2]|uniref:metallophosphoesterase n=1 Tax=Leifsonia sp. Root112D2 TaxID=1736426 RepID=UPI000AA1D20D|nr:metallophosphoesterase [Leifsonia sp. Root112D2]
MPRGGSNVGTGSGAGAVGVTLAALGAAAAASFAWGSLVERKLYTLRRVSVPVLAPGAAPIRVLHLSDLHMAPWQHDKQRWVSELARLKPDLIVNTGDNLGHADGLEGIRRAFDAFAGIPGVYVHGSNDYFGPTPKNPLRYFTGPSQHHTGVASNRLDTEALEAYFAELGWLGLNNAAGALDINGTHLEFFGVNDPHRNFDKLELIAGALDELRENDPFAEDATWPEGAPAAARSTVTIGVAHAPYQRVLNSFVTHGASVIFAGHTHGGQVCVPGFGALVTNCDIPRRQVKGLSLWRHALRSAWLNVSAGIGTSIYAPVRFACRPEATLLTLTPSAG